MFVISEEPGVANGGNPLMCTQTDSMCLLAVVQKELQNVPTNYSEMTIRRKLAVNVHITGLATKCHLFIVEDLRGFPG